MNVENGNQLLRGKLHQDEVFNVLITRPCKTIMSCFDSGH